MKNTLYYAKYGGYLNFGTHIKIIQQNITIEVSAFMTTTEVLVSFNNQHICLIVSL